MNPEERDLPPGAGPEPPGGADAEYAWAVEDCGPDSLDRVVEVAALMDVFAAQRLVAIDVLHRELRDRFRRGGHTDGEVDERSIRLELAAALRVTEHTAAGLIALADALVHRYPAVLDALAAARITERHAEILVAGLAPVAPEVRAELLPRAIELATTLPVGSFRRALRRLVDDARAVTLAERHERAVQTRRALVTPAEDGMSWLEVLMPSVEAQAIFERATATARVLGACPGETRTLDQLRADVVADLLIDGVVAEHPVEARGIRATVAVTVPALALLEDPAQYRGEPARVEGVGPIPLQRAARLCGGADGWMRILTHPETGMVLSVGRTRYRPPPGLRALVKWRADRCMAPGCSVPAARCQIDHNIAWEHGGTTDLENLCPFCTGHHTIKHHGGWGVQQVPGSGGAIEWTSPTGRRYLVEPERPVPVFTPAPGAAEAPF